MLWLIVNLALGSGLQLSWKVQDSSFGTSVQLLWKRNGLGGATEPVNQLATTGSLPTLSSSRKKRKKPSQIRRSRKRLEDFLQRKAQGSSGKPLDSAKEATVTDQDGDPHDHRDEPVTSLDSLGHSDEPVTSLDVDLAQCDSVTYEEREGIPGVQYITDNHEEGWTPVRQLRRGWTRNRDDSVSGDEPDSDTEDFVLPVTTKAVRFLTVNGTPGLHVTTRNTKSWTPIATRTRTKLHVI